MDAELNEVRSFLSSHHPFDLLTAEVQVQLARSLEVAYRRRGTVLMKPGDSVDTLYLVRTGAIETRDPEGQLLARLGEGECCGVRALLRGGEAVNCSEVIEDSLLYLLPAALFNKLREDHPAFAYYFAAFDGGRLRDSYQGALAPKTDLLTKRVGALLVRGPVTVPAAATLREAACVMREQRVSCAMVVQDGDLVGILTDRDLRNRVVADDRPGSTPVRAVMTANPFRVQADDHAFDALLLMSRHNIHHLPVMEGNALVGCLTSTTLVESHTTSPLYLARNIHTCATAAELAEVVRRVPHMVHQLVEGGANVHSIGHIVSTLTDSVTQRLIRLAENELGPAPVPYAWLAAGSQARHEQTAQSDQDNCLIIDDSFDPAAHGPWFEAFSRMVCDGLHTCGYVHCPGEMMAMTPQWRQPQKVWYDYFRRWIREPEPKALMLSCVFFDLRVVHGEAGLFEPLHAMIMEESKKNRIFQAYMAKNAMTHEPPVGFFRNFVLIRGGDHDHTLDLKHNGLVPIVDLARVYALAAGIGAVNTHDRLHAACEAKVISHSGADDLIDALDFIGLTRLRHQARMIAEGRKADNYLAPEELSSFERGHLKGAFGVVKSMQGAMAQTFQLGRF